MILFQPDDLPRSIKTRLSLVADIVTLVVSFLAAVALKPDQPIPRVTDLWFWLATAVLVALGAGVIGGLRLPNVKLQSFDKRTLSLLLLASVALALLTLVIGMVAGLDRMMVTATLVGAFFFALGVIWRLTAIRLLTRIGSRSNDRLREPVAIYGAGTDGIQLASALRQSANFNPLIFFDDNPNLQRVTISGMPVYHPANAKAILAHRNIGKVLLAMPSASNARRKALVEKLSGDGIEVQILPSYVELMTNPGIEAKLRPVRPDELLGRTRVALDTPEILRTYAERVVMVTGAGGSIGSELCRQLIACEIATIVLFEQSEYALYKIERELRELIGDREIEIFAKLGSVTDRNRVSEVIRDHGVEIILHAAAYKHVPLVEDNELEGARNNVLGTQTLADAAGAAGIERFILISTDKAIRPTNVMGATKRLSEMIVQDRQTRYLDTTFAMVRFGNVLGSSGSVVPLFQKQISVGGPVTVTHPDVTRFFMVIPEAARLVLLAGAYAEGGDVFVLDMGKPQRVLDIARKMIELSGLTVRDAANPAGDIEIQITGMRPGEKLYEELLIDKASQRETPHPKILRAQENMPDQTTADAILAELSATIERGDKARLRCLLEAHVDGYHRIYYDT